MPKVDYPKLLTLGRELLLALGEDPDREGLLDTPRRWADAWQEFIEYQPGNTETCFTSSTSNQIICISGLSVNSVCEHHLMPFTCRVSIGYIPKDVMLGLSKFARIAHKFAHQLQVQEQLGMQIADELCRITGTQDVAVNLNGEHHCMNSRGIRTSGTMTTFVTRGAFLGQPEIRAEFLHLVDHR
ncbi:GTP cyclohydrolase I [Ktedonospora formicarum]|nr:GTP cyclohydrolase I FolE [Ktedonospora formicarum]